MKKSVLTTAITLMMASSSFAVVGNKTTLREGGPEALCRMTIRVAGNKLLAICSATLVAPNKILTAGHCSPQPGQDITVECGYQGYTESALSIEATAAGTKVFTQGVHFKDTAKASVFYKDLSRDSAVLLLDKNLKSRPLRVAADVNFKTATNCVAAGFGRTNDATAGILHQGVFGTPGYFEGGGLVSVAQVRVKGLKAEDLQTLEGIKKVSETNFLTDSVSNAMPRPGDSGGPLLCRDKGGMYVAGVFSFVTMLANPELAGDGDSSSTAINHYNAFHTSRPVLLKAIEQNVAPTEEAFQRKPGDRVFNIPGMEAK